MISEGQKFKNIFVWNHSACENALIQKCRESKYIQNIFFANRNSLSMTKGIIPVKSIKEDFFKELKENNVNIILANAGINNTGFMEMCAARGFECIGADKRSCKSEKSKIFSKNLMKKYDIATAPYIVLEHPDEVKKEIKNIKFPSVVKADGYAKSLSAATVNTPEELYYITEKYLGGYFNDASKRIIIEDCVMDKNGKEVSVPLICDGKTLKVINFVRDYKRHLDGDAGSNTGSMGSYCPYILSEEQKNLIFELAEKLQTALSDENLLYKGFMNINVIINDNKAYLLEINTRLGDSEGQVVLELMENDICELFEAMLSESLDSLKIKFKEEYSTAVNIVTSDYPDFPNREKISFLTKESVYKISKKLKGTFFYNGVREQENNYIQTFNRFISFVNSDSDLKTCYDKIYESLALLEGKDIFYRKDIGIL